MRRDAASDTDASNSMEHSSQASVPMSYKCHQQAGGGIRAVRTIPSPGRRWKQPGCWPGVPFSQFSFPKRFLEANVVRDLAAMFLASAGRYLDVFNRLLCCRGQTSMDASQLAAEGMFCMALCCLESQPQPRAQPSPRKLATP